MDLTTQGVVVGFTPEGKPVDDPNLKKPEPEKKDKCEDVKCPQSRCCNKVNGKCIEREFMAASFYCVGSGSSSVNKAEGKEDP